MNHYIDRAFQNEKSQHIFSGLLKVIYKSDLTTANNVTVDLFAKWSQCGPGTYNDGTAGCLSCPDGYTDVIEPETDSETGLPSGLYKLTGCTQQS